MTFDFNGKVALVTGGASGIGRDTCIKFANAGAKVVVADLNEQLGLETVKLIDNNGGQAVFVKTDVTNENHVENMVKTAIDKFGQLDFAFNNAGMGAQAEKVTADYPVDEFKKIIDINLTGVWLSMKYEIPEILKTKGVLINTASILGVVGMHSASPYVASKHAVIGMTKTAAIEYATKGIRVNAICPGYIETPMLEANEITEGTPKYNALAKMHAMRRIGKPEEISGTVLFMCSSEASFMTGHAMIVDGGFTIK